MSHVETGTQKLSNLFAEVENGQIKIPQFQRDFVWSVEQSAGLVDSVIRGFPVGSLIYWRTSERLREVRNLGRLNFPSASTNELVSYVLDGQQRLTTLLAALGGETVTLRDGATRDFSTLLVHLNCNDEEEPIVRTDYPEVENAVCLPLTQLWARKGEEFDTCRDTIRSARDEYSDRLRTYDIPKVILYEAELSEATDVFSRINTGGQDLSVFEIMVAKTYDPEQEFDLVDKYDDLLSELRECGFETIDAATILQLIALLLRDDCTKRTILNLNRDEFIGTWNRAIDSLKLAVDYIRDSFGVPVSRLLPYVALVIPISIFFDANKGKKPDRQQAKMLSDFFWRAGWSERYSSSQNSKLAQDKHAIEEILRGSQPRLDWIAEFSKERLADVTFSVGTAFSKTILGLLASLGPRKYDSGDRVNLQNDHMHRANSLNFHHIFPKAYLKNEEYEEWEANRLVNISLVDDFLNKRQIRARSPSDYMDEFWDDSHSDKTLKTHLIDGHWEDKDSDDNAPIWKDDYESFVKERTQSIVKKLKSKCIKR